jgi:excisionase family DNA binding protein
MTRAEDKTSRPAGPRVGGRAARAGRGSSGVPVNGAVVSLAEPLLDCEGAAALLNVRVSWVRDAARLGHLPSLRVGRHLRFSRTMLEEWLAGRFESPSPTVRPYARTAGAPAVKASAFRRRTQAALPASLAENPKRREVDDG